MHVADIPAGEHAFAEWLDACDAREIANALNRSMPKARHLAFRNLTADKARHVLGRHRQLATPSLKCALCVGPSGDGDLHDFRPGLMGLSSCLAAVGGGGCCSEEIGDLVVGGEETLRLSG